jgi:hypothetical protein
MPGAAIEWSCVFAAGVEASGKNHSLDEATFSAGFRFKNIEAASARDEACAILVRLAASHDAYESFLSCNATTRHSHCLPGI